MTITRDSNVDAIPLEELARMDMTNWIALRQFHPHRYAALEVYATRGAIGGERQYKTVLQAEEARIKAVEKWERLSVTQYDDMSIQERTRLKQEAPEVYDRLTRAAHDKSLERTYRPS